MFFSSTDISNLKTNVIIGEIRMIGSIKFTQAWKKMTKIFPPFFAEVMEAKSAIQIILPAFILFNNA